MFFKFLTQVISDQAEGSGMDDPAIYLHSDKRQTGMYLYR